LVFLLPADAGRVLDFEPDSTLHEGMGDPGYSEVSPGVFLVRYLEAEDLLPDRQAGLIAQLERVGATRRVGIIFDVSDRVRFVDMSVPAFWLKVTARRELAIAAMAIVTSSAAVRWSAVGFGMTNRIRGIDTDVQTFTSVAQASKWIGSAIQPKAAP